MSSVAVSFDDFSRDGAVSGSSPVLSVVSPIHCEELGLKAFLDRVEEVLRPLRLSYEIVLVDDGSTDSSWQRMHEEFTRRPSLRCLRLSRNFGKEAALVAGLHAARGQAVITLDSDLQHPPECIVEMVRLWQQGDVDLVEAQKSQRQKESFLSRLFAKSFYALFALVAPFDLKNASDFKLMDRKVLDAWKQLSERRVFFRGMSSWLGFRQKVVFFEPHDRQTGVSQWSFLAKIMLALDSLSAYTTRLLFLIWGLSLVFGLFAVGVGGEALWMKFQGRAMSGFTTVILLILISTASVLAALCLLSLYVRQIFYEVKGRPLYLISEHLGDPMKAAAERSFSAPQGRTREAHHAVRQAPACKRRPHGTTRNWRRGQQAEARAVSGGSAPWVSRAGTVIGERHALPTRR